MRNAPFRAAAPAVLAAALMLGPSCGPNSLAVRSVPFPAEKPVLADASGNPLRGLPPCPEPVRLVLVEAPWCPPCDDVRKAIRESLASVPPGSVRIFRVLFDRERFLAKEGARDAPPLNPPEEFRPERIPVTTLVALPGPFRERFRLDRFPVLLLLDERGAIVRRWTGFSPRMARELPDAVSRPPTSPLPPGT